MRWWRRSGEISCRNLCAVRSVRVFSSGWNPSRVVACGLVHIAQVWPCGISIRSPAEPTIVLCSLASHYVRAAVAFFASPFLTRSTSGIYSHRDGGFLRVDAAHDADRPSTSSRYTRRPGFLHHVFHGKGKACGGREGLPVRKSRILVHCRFGNDLSKIGKQLFSGESRSAKRRTRSCSVVLTDAKSRLVESMHGTRPTSPAASKYTTN